VARSNPLATHKGWQRFGAPSKPKNLRQGRYRIEIRNEIRNPPDGGALQKCAKVPNTYEAAMVRRLPSDVEPERHCRLPVRRQHRQHDHQRRPQISVCQHRFVITHTKTTSSSCASAVDIGLRSSRLCDCERDAVLTSFPSPARPRDPVSRTRFIVDLHPCHSIAPRTLSVESCIRRSVFSS